MSGLLRRRFLAAGSEVAFVAAHRAAVGLGALSADRQTLGVAKAAVAFNVFQSFNVAGFFTAQIAFGFVLLFHQRANLVLLLLI